MAEDEEDVYERRLERKNEAVVEMVCAQCHVRERELGQRCSLCCLLELCRIITYDLVD